jgi:pSer/pThr/pTyr-binding forkhead associated (FHA) protein
LKSNTGGDPVSLFTSIGGIWNRITSAFERTDIGTADTTYDDPSIDDDRVRPTATRYTPIKEAVERRVNAFLRQDLVSHLEIGFNEIFFLHYIEITADSQGMSALAEFLSEFSPEARIHWVKKLLGRAVGQHVDIDQFMGLDKEFPAEALAETDPFEEKLNQAATPVYRVILHGRWDSRPATAQLNVQEPGVTLSLTQQTSRVPGPRLQLSVHDAKSLGAAEGEGHGRVARTVDVEDFPAVLGSSVNADVDISGYYVSARHCTLHCSDRRVWLEDHSTNGTWVDGQRVARGSRVPLTDGAVLGFGREKGGGMGQGEHWDHDRYPAVRVRFVEETGAPGMTRTPVAPSLSTPIAPAVASSPMQPSAEQIPLAVLAIVDATGTPKRDVLKLPFTIGRGSAQDYVVPDANEGVSREHLVIEEIGESGAVTLNRAVGKNGTFAGNQPLPERFMWRFGQEIVLGEKWTSAPAVRLTLRQMEPAA